MRLCRNVSGASTTKVSQTSRNATVMPICEAHLVANPLTVIRRASRTAVTCSSMSSDVSVVSDGTHAAALGLDEVTGRGQLPHDRGQLLERVAVLGEVTGDSSAVEIGRA